MSRSLNLLSLIITHFTTRWHTNGEAEHWFKCQNNIHMKIKHACINSLWIIPTVAWKHYNIHCIYKLVVP